MKYDLCCLGSAIVDLTFQVDDDFTKKNEDRGIAKGAMTLIEKNDQNNMINELTELGRLPEKACGGSATNSVVAASLFGSKCYMSCIVANDANGNGSDNGNAVKSYKESEIENYPKKQVPAKKIGEMILEELHK